MFSLHKRCVPQSTVAAMQQTEKTLRFALDQRELDIAEERARYNTLLEKYHALLAARVEAANPPRSAPKPARPPRDPLVDNLTADLVATMGDSAAARAEAERIKREAFGGGL